MREVHVSRITHHVLRITALPHTLRAVVADGKEAGARIEKRHPGLESHAASMVDRAKAPAIMLGHAV
jgi:hypothetical protein